MHPRPARGDHPGENQVADESALFGELKNEAERILAGPGGVTERLQAVCDLLCLRVGHYDWVGFYLVGSTEGILELGPFHGKPTDHVRIPFGKGVCGQAAAGRKTIIVQDVGGETNYLSCSPDVRAEIVIPLFRGDEIIGELDIDSHEISPFTDEDRELLEAISRTAEKIL